MSDKYVNPQDGSDANDGLTPATAWATLQFSADTAANTDVVHMASGRFVEDVSVGTGQTGIKWTTDGAYVVLRSLDSANPGFDFVAGGSTSCEVEGLVAIDSSNGGAFRIGGSSNIARYCTGIGRTNTSGFLVGGFGTTTLNAQLIDCVGWTPENASSTQAPFRVTYAAQAASLTRCVGYAADACGVNAAALVFNGTQLGGSDLSCSVNGCTFSSAGGFVVRVDEDWSDLGPFSANYTGDRNCFHTRGGATKVGSDDFNSVEYATIGDWQGFVGGTNDDNSIDADPLFADAERGVFGFLVGSPCLTLAAGGTRAGPYGELKGFRINDDWGGATWSFPDTFAEKEAVTNKIALVTGQTVGDATATRALGASREVVRVLWDADEVIAAGNASHILDEADEGSPSNPMTIGVEINSSATPTPAYVSRERGKAFSSTGTHAHFKAILRKNGQVRA